MGWCWPNGEWLEGKATYRLLYKPVQSSVLWCSVGFCACCSQHKYIHCQSIICVNATCWPTVNSHQQPLVDNFSSLSLWGSWNSSRRSQVVETLICLGPEQTNNLLQNIRTVWKKLKSSANAPRASVWATKCWHPQKGKIYTWVFQNWARGCVPGLMSLLLP